MINQRTRVALLSIGVISFLLSCTQGSVIEGESKTSLANFESLTDETGPVELSYIRNNVLVNTWAVFVFQAGAGTGGVTLDWIQDQVSAVSNFHYHASLKNMYLRGKFNETQAADYYMEPNGNPIPISSACDLQEATTIAQQVMAGQIGQSVAITDIYDKFTLVLTGCDVQGFSANIGQPESYMRFTAAAINTSDPFYPKAFNHEMGHSLGLRHAGRIADDAGTCEFGSEGFFHPDCKVVATGDPFSLMSWGSCTNNDPSLPEKVQLGWTTEVVGHRPGTGSYELHAIEEAERTLKGVRLNYGVVEGEEADILISFRTETITQQGFNCVSLSPRVELHVTAVPNSLTATPNFAHIVALDEGESYSFTTTSDSSLVATITVDSIANGVAQITVTSN